MCAALVQEKETLDSFVYLHMELSKLVEILFSFVLSPLGIVWVDSFCFKMFYHGIMYTITYKTQMLIFHCEALCQQYNQTS